MKISTMAKPKIASGFRNSRRLASPKKVRRESAGSRSTVTDVGVMESVISYTRVNKSIEDIHNQITPGINDREDNQIGLQQRIITGGNRLHEQPSHTGPAKNQFNKQRAREQISEAQPPNGYDRQQRITKR